MRYGYDNEDLIILHEKGFEGGPFKVRYVGTAKQKMEELLEIPSFHKP